MVFSSVPHLLSPGIQLSQIFTESCSHIALWEVWEDQQVKKKKKPSNIIWNTWFYKPLSFRTMWLGSSLLSLSPSSSHFPTLSCLLRNKEMNPAFSRRTINHFLTSASKLSFNPLFAVYAETSQMVESSIDITFIITGAGGILKMPPTSRRDSFPLVFQSSTDQGIAGKRLRS